MLTETPVINGKPGIWIQTGAGEKVNLGNYSNADIGPVIVGKWIEDTGDSEQLEKEIQELTWFIEGIVAKEREAVLESLRDS